MTGSEPQPDQSAVSAAQAEVAEEDDLRFGVEGLAQLVAGSVPLEDLLRRVAHFAVRAIPGADGAGVTMYDSGHPDVIVASTDFVRELDSIQYGLMEGPCVTAAAEAQTVRSGSLGGEPMWPRFGPRAGRLGVHSAVSIPLLLDGKVLGAINVYARGKDVFDEHAAEMAEMFGVPAAVAVHNARVLAQTQRTAAQLQLALESRSVIDQAIGILRSRSGGTVEDAFDVLKKSSQSDNVKLKHVAQQLVDESVRRARARRTE
jgi:GAF domain-containing protein